MSSIFRGNSTSAFPTSVSVSGSVSDGGENWTVEIGGTFDAVKSYTSKLMIGGDFTPVSIPSRNNVYISGWTISRDGATGTLRINYELKPGTIYTPASSPEKPAETREESIAETVTAVSLVECQKIWSKSYVPLTRQARAIFVDYAKSKIGLNKSDENYDALVKMWEKNFNKDIQRVIPIGNPWLGEPFLTVYELLCNGQDMYNVETYQFNVTEVLNKKPNLNGINTYNTPDTRSLSLPSGEEIVAWYQNSDTLSVISNGQFKRTRSWLAVSDKSPLYADNSEA